MTARPRHRQLAAPRCGNDASTHHRRTRGTGHGRTPEPGYRSQAACNGAGRPPPPRAAQARQSHLSWRFLSFPFSSAFSSPGNEQDETAGHRDRDVPGHAGIRHPASWQAADIPQISAQGESGRRYARRTVNDHGTLITDGAGEMPRTPAACRPQAVRHATAVRHAGSRPGSSPYRRAPDAFPSRSRITTARK